MAEALAVASSVAGILSLGIQVSQGLLSYYGSWKDAESDVKGMYNSVAALLGTFELLKGSIENKKFDAAMVADVEKNIKACEDGVHNLKEELDKVKVVSSKDGWTEKIKTQLRRTLYPFKRDTLSKLKDTSNELRDNLKLALSVLQMSVPG